MDEHYDSVDEILGDPTTRYFGSGYRNVQQHLSEGVIDTIEGSAIAVARVSYPDHWSSKKDRELVPHLSSIDGFVLAIQLVEAYLREAFGLDDDSARECWIQHCTIKSGQAPTTDLERIPATLTLASTKLDPNAMFGRYSDFRVKVGSLGLDLVIDHPIVSERRVRAIFADVEDTLGAACDRYYGDGFKQNQVAVRHLELNSVVDRASATVSVAHSPVPVNRGLSGNYLPFIAIPDALVGTAQIAQAVLYRRDNLTRATSRNMWMRKISVTIPRPAFDTTFGIKTWIAHSSVLSIGESRWRTARFKVTLPSMTSEFSLAHELPAHEMPLAAAG